MTDLLLLILIFVIASKESGKPDNFYMKRISESLSYIGSQLVSINNTLKKEHEDE